MTGVPYEVVNSNNEFMSPSGLQSCCYCCCFFSPLIFFPNKGELPLLQRDESGMSVGFDGIVLHLEHRRGCSLRTHMTPAQQGDVAA